MQMPRLAVPILVLALAAGCAPANSSTAPAAGSTAATTAPIRLRAAYTSISGVMSPLWAAVDAGLFAREGLKVELFAFPSGNEGIQALMAGEIDFLQIAGATVVSAALGGADTVVLATTVRTLPQSVVVRPEIVRPEDLRGKAIGISRLGTSIDTAARVGLRHFGLEPEREVAIVQVGSMQNMLGALESGRVQAAIMSYPTVTQAHKLGLRELLDVGTLGIAYASTGVAARRSYVAAHPDVARRYLRAILAAIHRLRADKPFALEVLGKYLSTDEADVLEDTYEVYLLKYMDPLPYPDERSIQGVLDELAAENPRAAEAKPGDFFDDRLVRELDASGYIRGLDR
jgi:NitT/TauT family transport system substrate-binding protein